MSKNSYSKEYQKKASFESEQRNYEARQSYKKQYYQANKERVLKDTRRNKLKRKYGITPEGYEIMFKKQKGVCAVCSKPQAGTSSLRVDHCHDTGLIRGLLCHKCNAGIGMLGDRSPNVVKAAAYLKKADRKAAKLK